MIRNLFTNWRFRSTRPAFIPGEDIRAYLTGFDPATGAGTVRIGDTVLRVEGVTAGQVDQLIDLRIESFDAAAANGRAALRR